MDVLAVIHGDEVRSGVFADAAAAAGHHIEEWSIAWGTPPPRPLEAFKVNLRGEPGQEDVVISRT